MTREDLLPVLPSLRDEVERAWLDAFVGPPSFDPTDRLDGEALEFLLGKDFREILPLNATPLESVPVLSLLPLEAACYYTGAHVLDMLWTWEKFMRRPPLADGFVPPIIFGLAYFSLLSQVKEPETRKWFARHAACERAIGAAFAFISGSLAEVFPDEFMEGELEELLRIVRDYRGSV